MMAAAFANLRNHHHTSDDGLAYLGVIFFMLNIIALSGFFELPRMIEKLPVFYKQRNHRFFPTWAFSLPASILGIPVSLAEVLLFVATIYYSIGFDPSFTRPVHCINCLLFSSFFLGFSPLTHFKYSIQGVEALVSSRADWTDVIRTFPMHRCSDKGECSCKHSRMLLSTVSINIKWIHFI